MDIPGLKTQPCHLWNFSKVSLPFSVLFFAFTLQNEDVHKSAAGVCLKEIIGSERLIGQHSQKPWQRMDQVTFPRKQNWSLVKVH